MSERDDNSNISVCVQVVNLPMDGLDFDLIATFQTIENTAGM